jgi:hypothetical protein
VGGSGARGFRGRKIEKKITKKIREIEKIFCKHRFEEN